MSKLDFLQNPFTPPDRPAIWIACETFATVFAMQKWVLKIADFRPLFRFISDPIGDTVVTTEEEQELVSQVAQ